MSVLYQHQEEGAQWLAARATGRGYLGDVPGLGKTRTLLRAMELRDAESTLVVCPAIVRTHWKREAAALGMDLAAVKSYEEIVRGGDRLKRELLDLFDGVDSLILDEAHYCKNGAAQRTKMLLGKKGYARGLETVFCASGTPVSKNPAEIWTMLSSMFPEVAVQYGLQTKQDFITRYCTVRTRWLRGREVVTILPEARNTDEFQELLGQIMLRRTLDDVGLDVPALDWQIVRLDGGDGVDSLVDQALNGSPLSTHLAVSQLDRGIADDLEDIANDPHVARMRRRLGEIKAPLAAAMLLDELADSNEKVVVFAYHRSVLETLRTALGPLGVAYVDGDVTGIQRDHAIDRFQSDPNTRVFLGQDIACQTGITLTAARRMVLVEPEYTRNINLQLGKRIARIGQTAGHCVAQMMCLAGTLDEAIVSTNHRQARMAEAIGLGI